MVIQENLFIFVNLIDKTMTAKQLIQQLFWYGYTAAQIARECKIPPNNVYRWYNNDINPTNHDQYEALEAFCNAEAEKRKLTQR